MPQCGESLSECEAVAAAGSCNLRIARAVVGGCHQLSSVCAPYRYGPGPLAVMLDDIPLAVTMTPSWYHASGLHSGLQHLVVKLRGLPDHDAVTCMPRAVTSLLTPCLPVLLALKISIVPPMKSRVSPLAGCAVHQRGFVEHFGGLGVDAGMPSRNQLVAPRESPWKPPSRSDSSFSSQNRDIGPWARVECAEAAPTAGGCRHTAPSSVISLCARADERCEHQRCRCASLWHEHCRFATGHSAAAASGHGVQVPRRLCPCSRYSRVMAATRHFARAPLPVLTCDGCHETLRQGPAPGTHV